MNVLNLVLQILTSLIALIPLVVALVKYVKKATKEKNWNNLIKLVLSLCATAEDKFNNGADRKEWVVAMVKASASTVNYDVDETELRQLIDDLISLTKEVNVAITK